MPHCTDGNKFLPGIANMIKDETTQNASDVDGTTPTKAIRQDLPCSICGKRGGIVSWVEDKELLMNRYYHVCPLGHEFETVHVYPNQIADRRELMSAVSNLKRRWEKFKFYLKVVTDPNHVEDVARSFKMTAVRVRQIRASFSNKNNPFGWSRIALRNLERKASNESHAD